MIKQCGFLNRLPARPRKFTQCNASNYFSRPGMDPLYCTRMKTIHYNTSKQYDTLHSFPIHIIMIIRIVTMTNENWNWLELFCAGWICLCWLELFLCCLELFLYWLELFLCWLEWINLVAMKTPQRCPDCLRPLKHAFYPHHNYICVYTYLKVE